MQNGFMYLIIVDGKDFEFGELIIGKELDFLSYLCLITEIWVND